MTMTQSSQKDAEELPKITNKKDRVAMSPHEILVMCPWKIRAQFLNEGGIDQISELEKSEMNVPFSVAQNKKTTKGFKIYLFVDKKTNVFVT